LLTIKKDEDDQDAVSAHEPDDVNKSKMMDQNFDVKSMRSQALPYDQDLSVINFGDTNKITSKGVYF
jgi:hypothetical protein